MTTEPLRVAVGSTNPTKVKAVERIVARAFQGSVVEAVEVPSGVSAQPVGHEETRRGAANRARRALEAAGADLAFGLEGGVVFDEAGRCYLINWCLALDRRGRESAAQGVSLPLPPEVGEALRAGGELGPVMDALTGEEEVRKKGGAIGFFTNGLVPRRALWEQACACALAPFLHPRLYGLDD